jgi:predicted permease
LPISWNFPGNTIPISIIYAIEIIGRLRPGIAAAQAQPETAALWERYLQEAGFSSPGYRGLKRGRLEVRSIANGVSPIRDQSRTALLLLLAGAGLMLLIVCANVGGLLLSRATARERETAMRIALGASRRRILRQLLTESLLLVLTGGSAGFLIAYAGMPVLMHWMPPSHGIGLDPGEIRALALHFSLDFRVAAFSFSVCLLTALLCALAPAWKLSRSDVHTALKGVISDRRYTLFQSVLCGFQVALCTTLVPSTGLVVRTLENLRTSNTGFDRDHVVEFSVDARLRSDDPVKTWLLQQQLLTGVRNVPGVKGAAIAYRGLMRGIGLGISAVFPGQNGGGIINTSLNLVTPEYFDVMGIRLLMGRQFGPSDGVGQNQVDRVIVNEAFVRKFLNGQQPIGAKFGTGQRFVKPEYEIIGVVSDTKYRSLREVPPPIVYTDQFGPKAYWDTFILHVRTHGDPHSVIAPVRSVLRSIDPEMPLYQVATLSEEIDRSLWQERLLAALTSCFGVFALSLSAIGLYGLLAYFVVRREKEIGVRMALGANVRDIACLVSYRMVPILAAGIATGAALSWFVSTWARTVLYGVHPFDAVTYVAAIFLLLGIGIGGAAGPVFRAVRVDPTAILRWE